MKRLEWIGKRTVTTRVKKERYFKSPEVLLLSTSGFDDTSPIFIKVQTLPVLPYSEITPEIRVRYKEANQLLSMFSEEELGIYVDMMVSINELILKYIKYYRQHLRRDNGEVEAFLTDTNQISEMKKLSKEIYRDEEFHNNAIRFMSIFNRLIPSHLNIDTTRNDMYLYNYLVVLNRLIYPIVAMWLYTDFRITFGMYRSFNHCMYFGKSMLSPFIAGIPEDLKCIVLDEIKLCIPNYTLVSEDTTIEPCGLDKFFDVELFTKQSLYGYLFSRESATVVSELVYTNLNSRLRRSVKTFMRFFIKNAVELEKIERRIVFR